MPHDDFDLYAEPSQRQRPRDFNATTAAGHTPEQIRQMEILKQQAFPLSRGPGGPMTSVLPTGPSPDEIKSQMIAQALRRAR